MTEPLGIPHTSMGSGTSWVPDARFDLGTLMLGYVREVATLGGADLGLGVRAEVGWIPETLVPTDGTRHPAGIAVFRRIRPRITVHAHASDLAMHHPMP